MTGKAFWDGRVVKDELGVFQTPAGTALTSAMTQVFEFGSLSALPLFPVVSREEMRATAGNDLADVDVSDDHPEQVCRPIPPRQLQLIVPGRVPSGLPVDGALGR